MDEKRQRIDEYEAGMAAFHAGEYTRALTFLEPIAEGGSVRASLARFYAGQSYLRLGTERLRQGRYAAAANHFRRSMGVNPVAGGLCRYLASCYVALDRPDLAAPQLTQVLEADPDDVETRVKLALVHCRNGRNRKAEAALRDGLTLRPDEPELLYQLGTLVASEERYEEAAELLNRCLQRDVEHARAHLRLAQCHGALGRPGMAIEHLQTAQRLDPNDSLVAFQLSLLTGVLLKRKGLRRTEWREPAVLDLHDKRAMARLAEVIRDDPEFIDAFLTLPQSEVDHDVFTALLAILRKGINEHPQYADLRHRCAGVHARLGQMREAVAEAEHALAINPRYVSAMIQLAQLYQATDRASEGIARLEEAIRHGANYPDVHYLLGKMHQSRGQLDRARTAFEKALQLNHTFAAAREALASLAA